MAAEAIAVALVSCRGNKHIESAHVARGDAELLKRLSGGTNGLDGRGTSSQRHVLVG